MFLASLVEASHGAAAVSSLRMGERLPADQPRNLEAEAEAAAEG